MRLLNRTAITIRPKQPYLDWANSFTDGGPTFQVARARTYGTAFLLPEAEFETEIEEWIAENSAWLFEFQLSAWSEDESSWPPDRGAKTFGEWFEVDIHETVVDLAEHELEVEEI